jgi:hypothetical protein
VDQFPLQLAIAFFAVQVAAWAGLCFYLRATHHGRIEDDVAAVIADAPEDVAPQAA